MLKLVLPGPEHRRLYEGMMDEWEAHGGRLNPGALRRDGADYATWRQWSEDDRHEGTCPEGSVPQTLYFLMDEAEGRLLGAVTIRARLDPGKGHNGSSFGYGIRPGARGQGYGKALLRLAMEKAHADTGARDFFVTCDADNAASIGVILANGGVRDVARDAGEGTVGFSLRL